MGGGSIRQRARSLQKCIRNLKVICGISLVLRGNLALLIVLILDWIGDTA